MPIITLPDGSQHQFNRAVSTLEVARSVSPRLAEITLSGLIDGHHHDSRDLIERDVSLEIITQKDFYKELKSIKKMDFSNYNPTHLNYDETNKLKPGYWKDER